MPKSLSIGIEHQTACGPDVCSNAPDLSDCQGENNEPQIGRRAIDVSCIGSDNRTNARCDPSNAQQLDRNLATDLDNLIAWEVEGV